MNSKSFHVDAAGGFLWITPYAFTLSIVGYSGFGSLYKRGNRGGGPRAKLGAAGGREAAGVIQR